MKRAISFAIATVICCAQSLPANWFGMGGAFNSSSKPPVAGWYSFATMISQSGQLYSFTTHDLFISQTMPRTVQSSVRTGLATVVRAYGPLVVLGFGDGGMVAGDQSIGGAFSGGGIGVLRLGKTAWTIELGVRVIRGANLGQQTVWEMGTGRTG